MSDDSQAKVRELEAFARKNGLEFDIVYAKLPNTPPNEPRRFYVVAESGVLLYQPRDVGRTFDDAHAFIRRRAAEDAYYARELKEESEGSSWRFATGDEQRGPERASIARSNPSQAWDAPHGALLREGPRRASVGRGSRDGSLRSRCPRIRMDHGPRRHDQVR
jgi:hypothetical protein